MHNQQSVSCSPVAELLHEFIEDVVVIPNTRVGFGNKILEQPRSLYKRDECTGLGAEISTQLTEILILRVFSNEI